MFIPLVILASSFVVILAGCQIARGGYESAAYQVISANNDFEVRDYPALMVVETTMPSPGNGADGSFNRLFRFISGRNETEQKISMTTPVFISEEDSARTMAFVLPAKMKPEDVPQPLEGSVGIRQLPPGRFAVLRFGGRSNVEREKAALEQLKAWMETEGLPVLSSPVYGFFNPPWTPGFLRRNEVMLGTEGG